jgi:hypothetical protein
MLLGAAMRQAIEVPAQRIGIARVPSRRQHGRRQLRIVQGHPPIFVDQQGAHDKALARVGAWIVAEELDDPAKAADETPVTGIEAHQVPVLP